MNSCLNIFLVSLMVLMGQNWRTEACSCMPMHPQEHYCRSDMVIRGKIMRKEMMYEDGPREMTGDVYPWSMENKPQYLRYTVKVKKMYKKPGYMNETHEMYVNTQPMDSCGVTGLEESQTYVLAGYMVSGHMSINLCGLVENFSDLTKQQRQGLSYMYGRDSCSCEMRSVGEDADSCQYSMNEPDSCEKMYSMCLRNKSGVCKWKNNKMTKSCRSQLQPVK